MDTIHLLAIEEGEDTASIDLSTGVNSVNVIKRFNRRPNVAFEAWAKHSRRQKEIATNHFHNYYTMCFTFGGFTLLFSYLTLPKHINQYISSQVPEFTRHYTKVDNVQLKTTPHIAKDTDTNIIY
jgi:hypothetical protein